jgi:LacI family transcriptional regulator
MLAAELRVHPSTVSRALDPKRSSEVSSAMSARVRELAEQRGYEPDPWARSLRTRETRMLGMVMPRLTDPVLATMFEAAENRARDLGYQAVALSTHGEQDEQRRLVEVLLERRVDALILSTPVLDDPLLADLERRDVKFVLLNRVSADYVSIRGDDEAGGYLATRHLLGQGHKRIGMIAGPPDVSTAHLRVVGFRRAHEEFGLAVEAELVATSKFGPEDGVRAATHLLTLKRRPTAIFAFNDATAIGAMAVARDLGLRIPDDLAVIGYNDTDIAPLLTVPLSSVAVPLDQMGRAAIDTLVAHLRQPQAAPAIGRVFAPRLVARASSLMDVAGRRTRSG